VNDLKWKKIGVAVSGALLLGSTLLGAVTATTADVDKDFFINPENGDPMCLIVVGSNAAADDVVSASWIAAQIGSMAYYETVTPNVSTCSVIYDEEEEVDNYITNSGIFEADTYFDDFRLHEGQVDLGTPESWVVLPYVCDDTTNGTLLSAATSTYRPALFGTGGIDATVPIWDYDVYYDHNTNFGCDTDIFVDTGCSFESLAVDFSLRDWQCSQEFCSECTAACDQMGLWWYDENENETIDADEVGDFDSMAEAAGGAAGLVPIANTLQECQTYPNIYPRMYWGSPAWQEVCDPIGGMTYRTVVYDMEDDVDSITWTAIIGPDSEAYGVCDPNGPEPIDLYCSYCDVYFLGDHYNALSFGTNEAGVDYMFYGTPKWYVEEKLMVGESKTYGDFELTINDLGIYENKAYITITDGDGEDHDYVVVINTYTSNVPSPGDGDSDVSSDNSLSGYNEENDTIAFVEATCGTSEVVFAVKFVKTLIGAAGNYVVEYHAYNLLDAGCLTEKIYPGPCDVVTDDLYKPFVVADCGGAELEWYLDIIPADTSEADPDGVQAKDLDNDFALWTEGNPNFDAADVFKLYYAASVEPYESLSAVCVPVLELWLSTPVELAGMCSDKLTVCLDDLDGDNYFTLEVTDNIHTDYRIDGTVKLIKTEELAPTTSTTYVDIDPTTLVALDSDVENDPDLKSQYNLVLIGGPVANSLVQELVDLGFTTFDEWDTSAGDSKLFEDVYAFGKDVLVVAGSDRAGTAKAALDLIGALQA